MSVMMPYLPTEREDPTDEDVHADSLGEQHRLGTPTHRRRKLPWLIAAMILAVVVASVWQRPSRLFDGSGPRGAKASKTADVEELWFVPNPGHHDRFGNQVKDTWDHFQMPSCDGGPNPGAKHKVTHMKTVTDPDTGKTVKKKVTEMVAVKKTVAQKNCARHKSIAWNFHQQQIKAHWAFVQKKEEVTALRKWQGEHECAAQIVNTDFLSKVGWVDASGKESGAHCQRTCTKNARCDGFSWNKWGCWLKKYENSSMTYFPIKRKDGAYSGYPCNRTKSEYPWISEEVDKHTLPDPPEPQPAANASMLCLELVLPYSGEIELVLFQYKRNLSIFSCRNYAVYSSQLLYLSDGLMTRKINSSQLCEKAGQWDTALNTDTFMAFWRAVILDGDYLSVNWIVKVDPDTVWFPNRLNPLLRAQERANLMEEPGVYLNNCGQGLHGPVEVFSQNSLRALALHSKKCFQKMNDWGNWQWGEDMWVDQCFMNTAHSRRIYEPNLLAEKNCNKWVGWDSCYAKDKVAFHPFKSVWKYKQCVDNALKEAPPPTVK